MTEDYIPSLSMVELERWLQDCIDNENYEAAECVRKLIVKKVRENEQEK